ncbi:damage-inducible type I toxin DinQ [Xenorhabdus mauleonii]
MLLIIGAKRVKAFIDTAIIILKALVALLELIRRFLN